MMLGGTVLFADGYRMNGIAAERILTERHPGVHIERTVCGSQALMVQSLMRPEVVVVDIDQRDMTGEHLICELKRDLVSPFVIACARECGEQKRVSIMKMGANAVIVEPAIAEKTEMLIEDQLKIRSRKPQTGLCYASLQRMFAEAGISFELMGYRYLNHALMLLDSGEARLEAMGALYEKIGERFGYTPTAVERSIRYAVKLCMSRTGKTEKMSNNLFLSKLLSQKQMGSQKICNPRVSVFCADRRVFR